MPRRAIPSTSLLARVRAWFGLDQAAMALYLGVSPGTVHSIEAGRRRLTTEVLAGLLPLVQHLPPAGAAGSLVPGGLPAAAPPDTAAF